MIESKAKIILLSFTKLFKVVIKRPIVGIAKLLVER